MTDLCLGIPRSRQSSVQVGAMGWEPDEASENCRICRSSFQVLVRRCPSTPKPTCVQTMFSECILASGFGIRQAPLSPMWSACVRLLFQGARDSVSSARIGVITWICERVILPRTRESPRVRPLRSVARRELCPSRRPSWPSRQCTRPVFQGPASVGRRRGRATTYMFNARASVVGRVPGLALLSEVLFAAVSQPDDEAAANGDARVLRVDE